MRSGRGRVPHLDPGGFDASHFVARGARRDRCRRRSRSRCPRAAQQNRISITTGGTGGVYYPLGGGMANILSKYVPGLQATAEVTGGSVDNLKLLGAGKSEVAFSMVDAAWDALRRASTSSRTARSPRAR